MPKTNHPNNHSATPSTTPREPISLFIKRGDLPGSPEARRLVGVQHGGLPISLFLVDDRPGAGPLLHRHPYPELFIVHAGQADFEIDETRLTSRAGDILIAPATTAHRFTNTGGEQLRLTAIHTAPDMATEWLQAAEFAKGTPC